MDQEKIIKLLDEFTAVNGVSGNEKAVATLLEKYLAPITDEHYTDVLGNAVFIKKSKNPDLKLMFAAHMDEIGFMVSDITDRGYLTIVPIGFHNPNILVNQVMTIHTDNGVVYGVTGGGKPIHQTMGKESAGFQFQDILIDVGAETKEEVAALGIKIGDIVNMEKESHVLNGKFYSGKAVDNRSSVVAMILMMDALKDVETEATIYAVGTVQEELGEKGVTVITRRIKPDAAICIDVGLATEQDELNPGAARCYLGKGPAIEFFDWSPDDCIGNIVPRKMVKMMEAAADKAGIPYQHSVMIRCGTDACIMTYSNEGILTGGISLPERYIHTTIGMVSIADIGNAAILGEQFAKDFGK
ncbi:MAG: M20/M25/M40 family metallo-hydrolase [Lachnospiraceae bacterium]|nr:M20/M25/M40 family metallo-hydrolase [Lachnospiraceae bacterium]